MCGRFNLLNDDGLQALLEPLGVEYHAPDRYNIAPTELIPVVLHDPQRQLHTVRWWLTPSWAPEPTHDYSLFNARAETLTQSRAFRGPFRHHRCIVPMSGYFEWQKASDGRKHPWYIEPVQGAWAAAGIWDRWEKGDTLIDSCALITTDAPPTLQWIHHRAPVLLPLDALERWLDPATPIEDLQPLLQPSLPYPAQAIPLGLLANNARNKQADIMTPVGDALQIAASP